MSEDLGNASMAAASVAGLGTPRPTPAGSGQAAAGLEQHTFSYTPKLSKFEQDAMQQAHEQHKRSIVKPQVGECLRMAFSLTAYRNGSCQAAAF